MSVVDFPAEYFLKIEGQEYLLGRLVINKMNDGFWVEIDIVQKESKKIWAHVADLYNVSELDEAITQAVQKLSKYLNP